jgi:hypothetical protein
MIICYNPHDTLVLTADYLRYIDEYNELYKGCTKAPEEDVEQYIRRQQELED